MKTVRLSGYQHIVVFFWQFMLLSTLCMVAQVTVHHMLNMLPQNHVLHSIMISFDTSILFPCSCYFLFYARCIYASAIIFLLTVQGKHI